MFNACSQSSAPRLAIFLLPGLFAIACSEIRAAEICAGCHADVTHAKQLGHRDLSCASCHGASEAHLQRTAAGRPQPDVAFNAKSPRTADARAQACLACHASNRLLAFWESGAHRRNEVACDNCHSVHAGSTPRTNNLRFAPTSVQRELGSESCTVCHKQTRREMLKNSHHPIIEGKLECSSCHDPHGTTSRSMLKHDSVNEQCTSCHAEKRGPFVFEHAPVEENCLTCHTPHGSTHSKLLAQKVPNLCQDCHDWSRHPGTYYSANQAFGGSATGAPNTRFVARSCLNCHTQVHGTNAPASRGQFIVR